MKAEERSALRRKRSDGVLDGVLERGTAAGAHRLELRIFGRGEIGERTRRVGDALRRTRAQHGECGPRQRHAKATFERTTGRIRSQLARAVLSDQELCADIPEGARRETASANEFPREPARRRDGAVHPAVRALAGCPRDRKDKVSIRRSKRRELRRDLARHEMPREVVGPRRGRVGKGQIRMGLCAGGDQADAANEVGCLTGGRGLVTIS